MARVRSIRDVAEGHLCTGCGVCAYLEPEAIEMVDDIERGRRPMVQNGGGVSSLAACPGAGLEHRAGELPAGAIPELLGEWGPVLSMSEGHAVDDEIRFAGSSGGAATALALFGIEKDGKHGVLHIRAREDVPYLNKTVLSRTRAELMQATGSRYAPASPCDGLAEVENAPGPCVFIGKPCDVAATRAARRLRPALDEKLGITIAIFCAGTPSTQGTLEMLKHLGVEDPAELCSVKYRGQGWPGEAEVVSRNQSGEHRASTSYAESWGEILQKHRQWRCYVCADHTGEFADISVGDPWYRTVEDDEPGLSLVMARTERGKRFIEAALAAGYLQLEARPPHVLVDSQRNLLQTRGAIWGRIQVLRILGACVPSYRGLATFPTWWKILSPREKLSSILGTARRVFRKRLRERIPVRPWTGVREESP